MFPAVVTLARGAAAGASCLGWLLAQAEPAATVGAIAPLTAIRAVLGQLDADFVRGDAAAYAAHFVPDQPAAHAMLQRQLARTFAQTSTRQRTSTVVGTPRRIGEHTAVRVRHQVELEGGPHALVPHTAYVEECLLALRTDRDGRWVPTLAVEAASDNGCVRDDRFRCPACNYEIGGVPGWLCVPLRSDRVDALEAASFHLLGSDVVCDVSVQVVADPQPPVMIAQQLADSLCQLQPNAKAGIPGSWLPPAYAGNAPAGLQSASVLVEMPSANGEGQRATLYVAMFGGLQHLLLVRGCVAALQTHTATIAALLASYRLVDRDRDLLQAAIAPIEHHTGGRLVGDTYFNPRCGVELAGAPGWHPVMLTGGFAFRVVWSSPHRSRLWLTGYEVPPGMSRWCRATANRWFEQQCAQRDVELLPNATESTAWIDDPDCDWATRTVIGSPRKPDAPEAPRRRWFRLLLRDNLLLVVDGIAATADDEAALQQMLRAIRRG